MRKELKPYADEAFGIVETAANEIGSRLPGSDGEKKFADYMAGKLEDIGIKPVKEKFPVSPRASIGGIPYAGWVGIFTGLTLLLPFGNGWSVGIHGLAFFACLATMVWLVCSVFLYKTWFDPFFKQEISQNVYGELLPKDGKYDYTIILSGHTDTSWNWKHSATTKYGKLGPVPVFAKMGFGIVAFLFAFASSGALIFGELQLILTDTGEMVEDQLISYLNIINGLSNFSVALFFLVPLFIIPGCFMVTMWADKNPRTASPGAMDNATGIGIAYAATKYFKENPDKMPAKCRIINFNCGAEEAGLRGSIEFTRRHKGEKILENCWNINIDSVADKDFFEVVHGDVWQFTRFDADLEKWFLEAMSEAGIEKPGNIVNPVGGCDSTPLTKAGVKSITFAAQDPVLTHYYHTCHDRAERFDAETVGTGLDVVLRVVDKIAAAEAAKGGAATPEVVLEAEAEAKEEK